jgi:hypothetical protein
MSKGQHLERSIGTSVLTIKDMVVIIRVVIVISIVTR